MTNRDKRKQYLINILDKVKNYVGKKEYKVTWDGEKVTDIKYSDKVGLLCHDSTLTCLWEDGTDDLCEMSLKDIEKELNNRLEVVKKVDIGLFNK